MSRSEERSQSSVNEIIGSAELSVRDFLNGSADYLILAQSSSTYLAFVIAAALFENATRVAGRQSSSGARSWINSDPSALNI